MERVVARSAGEAGLYTFLVLREGRRSLWAATEHYFVHGNFNTAPTYQVVASVTVVDHTYPSYTVSENPQAAEPEPANQPDPRYKCTRNY